MSLDSSIDEMDRIGVPHGHGRQNLHQNHKQNLTTTTDEEAEDDGYDGDVTSESPAKRIKLENSADFSLTMADNSIVNGSLGELLRSIKSSLDMRGRSEESSVGSGSVVGGSSVMGGSSSSGGIGVGGVFGVPSNSLNNNNNSDTFNNNISNGYNNNNNVGKSTAASISSDEVKYGEFGKFLADSEKDESMATVLELLHENYGLIQRYASGYDCQQEKCQYENLHEHFHCYDTFCRGKVLYKKYEIIRHLKWHKKRKESLKYGFYRFSSSDDCSVQYGHCQHNHKHTHYHCVHEKCDKVYISTSDVQMHANYHRKHEAIVKNGFQRFRATEDCSTDHCAFKGQKTTHFHCRRENCKYTFKNKADMEKHKTYHMKDEMLLRDGYKKFLKTEECTYQNCRFSRVCNHIHCMHENCHYVLHSSGQLLSHKRKHERMDTEVDYRRLQMARSLLSKFGMFRSGEDALAMGKDDSTGEDLPTSPSSLNSPLKDQTHSRSSVLDLLSIMSELTFRMLPLQMLLHMRMQMLQNMSYEQLLAPDNIEKLNRLSESGLSEEYVKQLYNFNETTNLDLGVTNLTKKQTSPLFSMGKTFDFSPLKRKPEDDLAGPSTLPQNMSHTQTKDTSTSPMNKSKLLFHPSIDYRLLKKDDSAVGESTSEVGMSLSDRQKALLDSANFLQFSSSKTLFNRKRGRPRKNHVMEVYNSVQDSPQAIFTSFKLEKNDFKREADHPSQNHQQQQHQQQSQVYSQSHPPSIAGEMSDFKLRNPDGSGEGPIRLDRVQLASPPQATPMTLFGTPDFGGFSQLLEKHMREIKTEPCATVTHELELSPVEKLRNQLKCVVCSNSFETFAEIKEHECLGKSQLEKPLLAFPPGTIPLTEAQISAFRNPFPAMELADPGGRLPYPAPIMPLALTSPMSAKESVALVKTTGTFFPDVNANKLKFY
ncbi:uncharacterized protein LOC129745683 [Uranotaenia lowii]|uniref:uncharacterized protein LOC129745683 n=1 Tax=Uranotaenia lowii TaxID=190385 RepID=UPI00247A6264|nr:uncharacterized protein LOC129745683 [Uranotaenia lowii]